MAAAEASSLERRISSLLAQDDYPVGENLRDVRSRQHVSESYDVGHLESTVRYEYIRPPRIRSGKVYCTTQHGTGCTVCTTCHFCRQKTVDLKTHCPRCNSASGIWCAACLAGRMGQNIDEVLHWCSKGVWACPVCLDICNCSGADCLRASHGWEKTGQLHHEAKRLGYKSVAHYLILTALDRNAPKSAHRTLPMPAQAAGHRGGGSRHHTQQVPAGQVRRQMSKQKAQQDMERMLQACRAAFAPLQDLAQQGERGCAPAAHDILDPADDREDAALGQLSDLRQAADRHLCSPTSTAAQVPKPLFTQAAAGGMVAPGTGRRQQSSRGTAGACGPGGASAANAAGGMPPPPPRATAASAAFNAVWPDDVSPSGAAAAHGAGTAPGDFLDMLGFDLQPGELGVLGIRACSPAPGAQQQVTPDAVAPEPSGSRSRSPAAAFAAAGARVGPSSTNAHGLSAGGAQQPQPQPQQQPGDEQQAVRQQEPGFGPEDLPGENAPGYGVGQSRVHGTARSQQRVHQSGAWSQQPFSRPNRSWYQPSQQQAGTQARTGHRRCAGHSSKSSAAAAAATGQDEERDAAAEPAAKRARLQEHDHAAAAYTPSAAVSEAADGCGDNGPCMAGAGHSVRMQAACDPLQQKAAAAASASGTAAATSAQVAQPWTAASSHRAGQQQGDDGTCPDYEFAVFAPLSHAQPVELQQGQEQQGPQQQQSPLGYALELQKGIEGLITDGIGPGGGLPYDELCHVLTVIMDKALVANSDFDRPLVVASNLLDGSDAVAPATDSNNLKITQVCDALLFLAKYVPPDRFDDIVRRFRGEPILDFTSSDPAARAKVLTTAAAILLEVLHRRAQPVAAVYEAWVAADGAQLLTIGAAAVQHVTQAALEHMAQAHEAMQDLTDCILEWMAVLQQELAEAETQVSMGLMAPLKLGPIKWDSAHVQCQQEWATGLMQQLQHQQDLVAERTLRLRGLQQADAALLSLLADCLAQRVHCLPRRLAAQLLSAPVTQLLLNMDHHPGQAEAQQAFLLMVPNLIKRAAPDLQQDERWLVQDMQDLQQRLPAVQQQLQQCNPVQGPLDSTKLQQHSTQLLQQLAAQHVDTPVRQQELFLLGTSVASQLRSAVDSLLTKGAAAAGPLQQLAPASLGNAAVGALAALYALQLQAGSTTWAELQPCICQAAEQLLQLFMLQQAAHNQRRLVLLLAAETAQAAPSLVRWGPLDSPRQPQRRTAVNQSAAASSGEGLYPAWQVGANAHTPPAAAAAAACPPQAAASPGAPSSIPAAALLQLWLRSMLDLHTRMALAKSVKHTCSILAGTPATATLLQVCIPPSWLQQPELLQERLANDADGILRAVIAKLLMRAVRAHHGEVGLTEVLQGLCKDLSYKQQEQEQRLQSVVGQQQQALAELSRLLRWQCGCLPTLLATAELLLEHPALDAAQPLSEVVRLMTSFMQDGIRAVCRAKDGTGGHCGQHFVQGSALVHLPAYLCLVVHMSGYAGALEGSSTRQWPAHPDSNSSQTLQQLVAASRTVHGSKSMQALLCSKIKALTCIRDVLGAALQYLSGQDEPQPQDTALLDHLASALEQQAAAGPSAQQAQQGYNSPGLLHHLLHTHVHAVLKAAAQPSPCRGLHTHRAINALHLVRRVLQRPGLQQQCSQQLLLPCLAFPVFELLRAPVGRCSRVLVQLYKLLEQLMTGPGGAQLLPQQGPAQLGSSGQVGFKEGALSKMSPIPQAELQELFYRLMVHSLQACVAQVAVTTAPAAAAQPAPLVGQQQQQQEWSLYYRLVAILGLPRSECTATVDLLGAPPAADAARLGITLPAVPAVPGDCRERVVKAAVLFASKLVAQHSVVLEVVSGSIMPVLGPLANSDPATFSTIHTEYRQLMQQLRAARQRQGLPAGAGFVSPRPAAVRPAQQQHQQQQHHSGAGGQQPLQHSHTPRDRQQPVKQSGAAGPNARPTAAHAARAGAVPAVSACGSQACSVAGPGHWQQARQGYAAGADPEAAPARRVHVPLASQCVSEGGGQVASCQVEGDTALYGTAAGMKQKRPSQQLSAANQLDGEGDDGDDVTSGRLPKRQRAGAAAAQQQQQQRHMPEEARPDVQGVDQGLHSGPSPAPAGLQAAGAQPQQQQQQPGLQQQVDTQALHQRTSQQAPSSTTAGTAGVGGCVTLVGYVVSCKCVDDAAGQPVVIRAAPEAGQDWFWSITLTGRLAGRAAHLLQRQQLQPGHKLIVNGLVQAPGRGASQSRRLEFQPTAGSKLLVHPTAAAAAGLRYTPEVVVFWQDKWAQRAQQKQARQSHSQQHKQSRSRDAASQQNSQPAVSQELQGHQAQVHRQQGSAQTHAIQPDSATTPPEAAQQRDQQQQHSEQQQGQQTAKAAAPVQGDNMAGTAGNGPASGVAAGQSGGAGGQNVQVPLMAAVAAAAVSQLDDVEDSQATIKYATLPSNW